MHNYELFVCYCYKIEKYKNTMAWCMREMNDDDTTRSENGTEITTEKDKRYNVSTH